VASGELTVDQGRKLALYMLPGYTEEMINELVVEPPEEPDAGPLFDEAIAGGDEEEPAFALFGKGSRPGQKKCVTGKTCGNSCISKNKECRKKAPEKAVEAVKEAAKSLEPEAFYDYKLTRWTSHGKEWAARLTDFDGVDGFKREFADVVSRNWSRSGEKGTTTVRLQGEGFYEVSDPSTGKYGTDARSFIEFRDGEVFEATRAEVVAHLESQGKKKLSIEEKKKELSLPELSGSEKQIAWAEKIRAQTLEKFDINFDYWAGTVTFLRRPNMESARAELRQMVLGDLTSKNESKWWIDAREQGTSGLVNRVGLRRFFDPDRILALRNKYIPLEAEFATPDQDDIDLYGLDLQEQAAKTINQWLGQIRELGKDSADLPEFAARIYDLYPDLSGQALTEVMSQAQMAASWIGADDAQGSNSPEFAAKAKNCKTGKTCGNSCISKNKECRKKPPEKAVEAVKAVASQLDEKPMREAPAAKAEPKMPEKIGGNGEIAFTDPSLLSKFNAFREKGEEEDDLNIEPEKTSIEGVSIEYKAPNTELRFLLPVKVNKEAIEHVFENGSGRVLYISWGVRHPDGELDVYGERNDDFSSDEALKIAMSARRAYKNQVQPLLKEGDILVNTPLEGKGGARAEAYKRQGFSEVQDGGNQFAIVRNGKLIPIQFGDLA
jgi:hypothetical protein